MRKAAMLLAALGLTIGWGTVTANTDPVDIVIRGEIELDSVYRNNLIDFNDDARWDFNAGSKSAAANASGLSDDQEGFNDVRVALTFHADLQENIQAVIRIEGEQIASSSDTGSLADDTTGINTQNSSFRTNFDQAYVTFGNFLYENLTMSLGIMDVGYDLRGDGNAFFLDTANLYGRTQLRNGGEVEWAFNMPNRPTATGDGRILNDLNTRLNGSRAYTWKWTWSDEMYTLDFFTTKLRETGINQDDHDIWGAHLTLPMENLGLMGDAGASTITGHLLRTTDGTANVEEGFSNTSGRGSEFWSYGAGIRWNLSPDFEVYGEIDVQSGEFNREMKNKGTLDEEDHSASAFYLGGRYNVPDASMPGVNLWGDISWWSYSGDDTNDDENEGYINYGDVDESMVVEDNDYGMGLSNNYTALRLKGGLNLDSWLPWDMPTTATIKYHMFSLNEDKIVAGNSATGAQQSEDDLGTELDIMLDCQYSDHVTFGLGFGWFFPGDAISENTQLGGINASNKDDDTVTIINFETMIRF